MHMCSNLVDKIKGFILSYFKLCILQFCLLHKYTLNFIKIKSRYFANLA